MTFTPEQQRDRAKAALLEWIKILAPMPDEDAHEAIENALLMMMEAREETPTAEALQRALDGFLK